jgi:outer membrane receptor protein involved in Fe transport
MKRALQAFYIGSLSFCLPHPALADSTVPETAAPLIQPVAPQPLTLVVHALNMARNGLSPDTGSSIYDFSQKALNNLPQGDFTPINEVLLQAPGVAQDSYGQLHVRGDHDDLQYRINGIIIPEGISGFGQTLDTHFADRIDLATGALPAQYGYRTAGVINITTKDGSFGDGGRTSVMAGSQGTLEGNQEAFGSSGPVNYYINGTYNQSDRGIEPPTSAEHPDHDFTQQDKEFGYVSYVLNPENRLSLLFGNATNRFQIPDNSGQIPSLTVSGDPNPSSGALDERQFEHNSYGILALQGDLTQDTDYQIALFGRNSQVLFKPDEDGDLAFNGIASRDENKSAIGGIQSDFSWRFDPAHTIRYGLFASYEDARSDADSLVFPADATGAQTSTTPLDIIDNHQKSATLAGVYLQDEWKALDRLTLNYGARFDDYQAYVSEAQIEPRIGAIYDLTTTTKLHTGYSHYFTPPPTELIAPVTLDRFEGTTGALATDESSSVRPEIDDYYDAGIIQSVGKTGLTLGLDGYYKHAHDLLDEGQFGQALIFAPFNYDRGYVKGVELTADYKNGPFSAYSNTALSKALGKRVTSGEYNFDADELSYINGNAVHLDHDQLVSGSAGLAYTTKLQTKLTTDVLYGSGLRSGFANTDHLPFYEQVNAAVNQTFDLGHAGPLDARFEVANLFDTKYEIRDGSGIGVFAPQYGPRRGFYVTLSKPF